MESQKLTKDQKTALILKARNLILMRKAKEAMQKQKK